MTGTQGEAIVRADNSLIWRGQSIRAAIGRAGIKLHKEEGDSATPAGLLPVRRVLYRADRISPPRCLMPVEPIGATDGWCDDPDHRDYNRPIRLPHEARHEDLFRRDHAYDLIAVLGWNDQPTVRGLGSAIFLHVAQKDFAPTEGCIVLTLPDLIRLLAEGLAAIRVIGDGA